jgi:hypothetical protein
MTGIPRSSPRSALRVACAAVLFFHSLAALPLRAQAYEPAAARTAATPSCACSVNRAAALAELRAQVAGARDVAQAQALATDGARQARVALDRARRLVFFDRGSLDAARGRLIAYESRVAQAATSEAVVAEFDATFAGKVGPQAELNLNASSCTYTTGEIIAVVLGLILGIIPGLILLFLLC